MPDEIDLEKAEPGKMFGGAFNAKDFTFLLVADKPAFTAGAFEQNPAAAAGDDLFFKSPAVPDDGKMRAMVDLKPHAAAIKGKLKGGKTPARAVVIATSKPGNMDPKKTLALVQQVTLSKKSASIKLTALVGSVGPANWHTHHHAMLFVEMVAKDVPQVTFETDPKTPWFNTPVMVCGVWEQSAPGQIGIKKMLLGSVGQGHGPNGKCTLPPGMHEGNWWPLWATQIDKKNGPIALTLTPGVENYVFGLYPRFPGQYVLTVKGTGPLADIVEKVSLSMSGAHPSPGD